VLRVLARDHEGVDDGWLCDKGRFAYQSVHVDQRVTHPLLRVGGELVPVGWDRALDAAAEGLGAAGAATGAIAGGETTNEEGFLLAHLMRAALGSANLDSRPGGPLPLELHAALHAPALQAAVPDLEFAHAVLVLDCEPVDDAPVLDLRIRKGVRRNAVKLAVATSRPSSLDSNAKAVARFAPGMGEAFCAALNCALGGSGVLDELAAAAGADAAELRALGELLGGAGEDVVIVYGERLTSGARGEHAARGLLNVAGRLVAAGHDGAGLLELPAGTNGRGLREVGVLPNAGPGLTPVNDPGLDTAAIGAAAAAGELRALYLLHSDPLRELPARATWAAALARADTVVAHAGFLTEGLWEHATVVFPAESYAEKEGTLTHPDGRVQRLRPAIARPGEVRSEWQVLADLSRRLGHEPGVITGPMASKVLFDAIAFYAGLTLDELGGRGVRWPDRPQAAAWPQADLGPFGLDSPPHAPTPNGSLRLGTFRSIWAAPEVELSPALKFMRQHQRAELHPADAGRLGVAHGDRVTVGSDGTRVRATVSLRAAVPEGTVFLETGIPEESASALESAMVEVTPE
jgi:NADH-quinone oxidoreductase subunit G